MNKKEFVTAYAAKTGKTITESKAAINAFMETVEEGLTNDGKVSFVGWGTFEVKDVKARKGRNPKTGKEVSISARKKPKFRAGKLFQKVFN